MMRFHVVNLGCKVNKAESDSMSAHLLATGNELVGLNEADVIIINTCTVTGDAEKKTRKAVRRALRENTYARVMVTGCAAAISPDFYRALDSRVEIIEKADFLSADPACRTGLAFPARVSVKVQDGCDHACTYCIVHVARGKAFSRPLDEIVAEVKALERAGIREVMLSGIDLGSYRFEKQALDALLSTLIEATHEMRFRISSVEPASLTPATIERIAQAEGRICRHLHLPLQSGSDKVLKEMNRHYNVAQYMDLIRYAKEKIPGVTFSSDIIVGFPGETDEEFEDTIKLCDEVRYDAMFTFIYSKRVGTPAASMPDAATREDKQRRFDKLLEAANRVSAEKHAEYIGKTVRVLVDGETGKDEYNLSSRTNGGRLVHLSGDKSLIGQFIDVKITSGNTWALYGKVGE